MIKLGGLVAKNIKGRQSINEIGDVPKKALAYVSTRQLNSYRKN